MEKIPHVQIMLLMSISIRVFNMKSISIMEISFKRPVDVCFRQNRSTAEQIAFSWGHYEFKIQCLWRSDIFLFCNNIGVITCTWHSLAWFSHLITMFGLFECKELLTIADLFFGVFLAFGSLYILRLANLVQRISAQPSLILQFIKIDQLAQGSYDWNHFHVFRTLLIWNVKVPLARLENGASPALAGICGYDIFCQCVVEVSLDCNYWHYLRVQ